ncbi:MAG: hypothetical protein OSJ58_17635 [Dysosmobacter sp.]|nr:hypothetical protein [Dysosmobacter sp.]
MNSMIMDFQKKQTQKLETPEMTAVMAAVNALVDHAAILAKNGGRDFLPDLRDLVNEMLWVWAPEDAAAGMGPTVLQKEYHKKINAAVKGQPAELRVSARQAGAIVRGLSIHAEEMGKQGSLLSIWQCCRLAKRLREDCAGQTEQPLALHGDFEIDESPRFMKFGSMDRDHVLPGRLFQYPVLIFNEPVPAGQVPEGWYSYNLSGRNIRESDRMWNFMPKYDYVGSVLVPEKLVRTRRNMMRIDGRFTMDRETVSLESFCEQNGFQTDHLDQLFPEMETEQIQGGMTLG